MTNWNPTPKQAYYDHRARAKKRNIEFDMTFEEWWSLWKPFWHLRGRKPNEYCMARLGDLGSYRFDNVKIITNIENAKETWTNNMNRKLSVEDVHEIRNTPRKHGTTTELAKKYNVDRTTIDAIIHGRSWKEI